MYNESVTVEALKGLTLTTVESTSDTVTFTADDGTRFQLYHDQDCCESVYVEDIVGDLDDLVGSPILVAEESVSSDSQEGEEDDESFTWTFYKFATLKGYVDIRFYGSSNGYYSESVDFRKL